MEKFHRVAYTVRKVVHVTCRDSTRDYTHSICVSQDETAEFDVNLTHFAESIEKKINPSALPADRNHSVLARFLLSLSSLWSRLYKFLFLLPSSLLEDRSRPRRLFTLPFVPCLKNNFRATFSCNDLYISRCTYRYSDGYRCTSEDDFPLQK